MNTVGIICEYNPYHLGHSWHIGQTRSALGDDTAVVCVMSGNYVQRGDLAVFNKHARAKMAILNGADLVIELPTPYALLSAGGFARAGVYILSRLGACDYISFGSESGNISELRNAANAIASDEAQRHIRFWLGKGLPYASALQSAAGAVLGAKADVFKSPNNLLAIEYIKAIDEYGSLMRPMTVRRVGGKHDTDTGYSASSLRKTLLKGSMPLSHMPGAAVAVCMEEIVSGRGPVFIKDVEQAILSRLRTLGDFSMIPDATEGLENRFMRFASEGTSIDSILNMVKTKRYAMSRLRRMLMCAALGIKAEDTANPPPYIRILATNGKGMELLKAVNKKNMLPVITKPASVKKLSGAALRLFSLEAAATDLYALAYTKEEERTGGWEWRQSPVIIK